MLPAFVAREFLEKIQESHLNTRQWFITTNNVLVYLSYSFTTITRRQGIKVNLVPAGPPENIYGASFGEIHDIAPQQAPIDHIPEHDLECVKKVVSEIKNGQEMQIIFAGTSGLELSKNPKDRSKKYDVSPGPHVGDYNNMLLKRAMFQTEYPIVIFLEFNKINSPFDREHCYPIFMSFSEWENICMDYPLAVCVGCKDEKDNRKAQKLLSSWGFNYIAGFDRAKFENQGFPLLVYNSVFLDKTNFKSVRSI